MTRYELEEWLRFHRHELLEPARRFDFQILRDINFSHCNLSGSDFSGAALGVERLLNQSFRGAMLEKCRFGPPKGELESETNLAKADFTGARLISAALVRVNLEGANLTNARLSHANLTESNCTAVDFSHANMEGVVISSTNLFQARFYRTRIHIKPEDILQCDPERWKQWCNSHKSTDSSETERLEQAVSILVELKQNFISVGEYGNASTCYIHERRMRRRQHSPFSVTRVLDKLIDMTTGYGESLLRTGLTLVITAVLVCPILYLLAGGVVRTSGASSGSALLGLWDLIRFSIANLLQGSPDLEPATPLGEIVRLAEQLFGVLMIGFLGFVLGNKINRK